MLSTFQTISPYILNILYTHSLDALSTQSGHLLHTEGLLSPHSLGCLSRYSLDTLSTQSEYSVQKLWVLTPNIQNTLTTQSRLSTFCMDHSLDSLESHSTQSKISIPHKIWKLSICCLGSLSIHSIYYLHTVWMDALSTQS